MQKRRSDISKLISKAREVWRQSQNYQFVKKQCKSTKEPGWFICENPGCSDPIVEVIRIDHKQPIGKQPISLIEFGIWLDRLFCAPNNLQGLCNRCHKQKTKEERRKK